jgi:hypothetical protein
MKMTDEKDVGSNTETENSKNKLAKMSVDQAYAEIIGLRRVVAEKDSLIHHLTEQLDEANKVLESQEKGRLIGEILPRSQFKMDDLVGQSVEDLKNINATLSHAMPPRVNSIRFGVIGADISDREKGLTVGDLSVVTAAKRKGAA